MEKKGEKCSFCHQMKDNVHLIWFPLEGNGVDCICNDCVKNRSDVYKTEDDKYYFWPNKK